LPVLPKGAEASATFFTLIETAKANGLEPYAYLRYLFENLPLAESESDYLKLLPNRVDMAAINEHAAAWLNRRLLFFAAGFFAVAMNPPKLRSDQNI
jgi:hypothetical protein